MLEVLKKYWGYDSFRPLQEDIIQSVLDGQDTLALLPTGGGKSICYQVPAMMSEGVCIVITPLVALMEDQVYHLRAKGIKAIAIHSALSQREVSIHLDNAIYGDYKFIYVAPERIQNEMFWARLDKMNVNLIAVDESHCISQWGYDFRPSYFKISELRTLKPNVPVLALTASATDRVQSDIVEKLQLKQVNIFKKSFKKENLQYVVEEREDKYRRIVDVLRKVPGSALVYCRNRKKTKEIAQFLMSSNIGCDFYHAGLNASDRFKKQQSWIQGHTRVMACTNAFGMGIDKADVRTVIHVDLPDSIEAYYQEAGRAGRDGKRAFAIMMYNEGDIEHLKEMTAIQFPDIKEVQRVYQALANYYQIGIGTISELGQDFNLYKLCNKYNLETSSTYHCLKILELEGLIIVSEAVYQSSKVKVLLGTEEIYAFQVSNRGLSPMLETLLRSYEGLFENYVKINENLIVNRLGLTLEQVYDQLKQLAKRRIIEYIPHREKPVIWFLKQRKSASELRYSQYFTVRHNMVKTNVKAMIDFVKTIECREQYILNYFDEKIQKSCGRCDICLDKKKDIDLKSWLLEYLKTKENGTSINEILESAKLFTEKEIISIVRTLIDEELIEREGERVCLNQK